MASNFLFGEDKLTVSAALDLVNGRRKGILSEIAKERILKGEQHVKKIVEQGSTVYGIKLFNRLWWFGKSYNFARTKNGKIKRIVKKKKK